MVLGACLNYGIMLPSDLEMDSLGTYPRKAAVWPQWASFPNPEGRRVSLACSLGSTTSSSKEALHLRGDSFLSPINAKATCEEPGRRQAATAEHALWVTGVGAAGG